MEEMDNRSFLSPLYHGRKEETQKHTKIEKTLLKHNKTPHYRLPLANNERIPWLDGHEIQFYA
jgi:hypothetical protein